MKPLLPFLLALCALAARGQNPHGIDVSHYNGTIDWTQVKSASIDFAYATATSGMSTDNLFTTNMANGAGAGVVMGAVHFAEPSAGTGAAQADYFLNVAGPYIGPGYLPPVLDLEVTNGLASALWNQWVLDWMMEVKKQTGIDPVVYTSLSFYKNIGGSDVPKSFGLWVAKWGTSTPGNISPWTNWLFWQYSSTGSVPGVGGTVDLDVFNGDAAQFSLYLSQIDSLYAPTFISPYPQVTNTTSTSVDLDVEMDEIGVVYFVVLPHGANAPTSAQVKAAQDAGGNPVTNNGSFVVSAMKVVTSTISGLAPNTSYDVYVVADDGYIDLQDTPSLLSVTTTLAPLIVSSLSSIVFRVTDPTVQSISRAYTLSGSHLTGDVTVTSTGDYLISQDTIIYGTSLTISANQFGLPQTIYVKFDPTQNFPTFSGSITHSSPGADDNVVNLSVDVVVSQSISFSLSSPVTFGEAPIALHGTSSSGLEVSYASSDIAVAAVNGNVLTLVGSGVATITASQPGDSAYAAASDVPQTLIVNKEDQTISFGTISDVVLGGASFDLSATASSGLTVSFTSSTGRVTIAGDVVTIVSAGRDTIMATQAGNMQFNAAPANNQTFCISPAKPTITETGNNTGSPTLTSSSSSGNQWFQDGVLISNAASSALPITVPGSYTVQAKVDDCMSIMSDPVVVVVTGNLLSSIEPAISIYPNPASNVVIIGLAIGTPNESVSATVYDPVGRAMSTIKDAGSGSLTLDISSFAQGVYLVKVFHAGRSYYGRFVKQ